MSSLIKFVKDFAQDEEGLTVVEYVVGAALLIIAFAVASPWEALIEAVNKVTSGASDPTTFNN